eukprot:TRINITY_DN1875_c0_g1_i3.p1 TRINITY_DN1875_c0_g1~~TRINITY_DN1875_c0_g1_i3.p1  ORF type:complete len:366 (+),score=125.56 TRINITY_DN1875_c0_g1_i3:95-1192(+)
MGGDGKKGGGKKGDKGKGKGDKGGDKGKGGGGKDKVTSTMKKIQEGEKIYTGSVKCYYGSKDIGFIYSEEVEQDHPDTKGDVFAFGPNLKDCRAGVGDEVAFLLRWSPKGQCQTHNPLIRLKPQDELFYSLKGTFKKTDKGFGFVSCDEVKNWFGKEVFVSANLCRDLEDGDHIAFNLYLNKAKQPNCESLYVVDKDYEPVMGDFPDDPKAVKSGAVDAEKAAKKQAERDAELALLTDGAITCAEGIELLAQESGRREAERKQAAAQAVAAAQAAQIEMQQRIIQQQQQAQLDAAAAPMTMAVDSTSTTATPAADGSAADGATTANTDASMDGGAESWEGWDGSWEGWDASWDGSMDAAEGAAAA